MKDPEVLKDEFIEDLRDSFVSGFADGYEQGLMEATKWIPVVERLPEKHQYVLVTYKGLDGRRFVVVTNWNPNTWIESKSVAWMPVPEPYEGGDA
jgi:hypothetical protein